MKNNDYYCFKTMVLIMQKELFYLIGPLLQINKHLSIGVLHEGEFAAPSSVLYQDLLKSYLQASTLIFTLNSNASQFVSAAKQVMRAEITTDFGKLKMKYSIFYTIDILYRFMGRYIYISIQNPGIYQVENGTKAPPLNNDFKVAIVHNEHTAQFLHELQVSRSQEIKDHKIFVFVITEKYDKGLFKYEFVKQILLQSSEWQSNLSVIFQQCQILLNDSQDIFTQLYIQINKVKSLHIPFFPQNPRVITKAKCTNLFKSMIHYKDNSLLPSFLIQEILQIKEMPYQKLQNMNYLIAQDKKYIQEHSIVGWIEKVLIDLKRSQIVLKYSKVSLSHHNKVAHNPRYQHIDNQKVAQSYKTSTKRIIIIHYDDILTQDYMVDYKRKIAVNGQSIEKNDRLVRLPNTDIMEQLKRLGKDQKNSIYLMYDGCMHDIDLFVTGAYNATILAESGYFYREKSIGEWQRLFNFDAQCLHYALNIVKQFSSKNEGSKIQTLETQLRWSCESSEFNSMQIECLVKFLREYLERFCSVEILQNSNNVSVVPKGLSKVILSFDQFQKLIQGMMIDLIHQTKACDWMMILGDENMLAAAKSIKDITNKYSIKSSLVPSYASYYLQSQEELCELLSSLDQ